MRHKTYHAGRGILIRYGPCWPEKRGAVRARGGNLNEAKSKMAGIKAREGH